MKESRDATHVAQTGASRTGNEQSPHVGDGRRVERRDGRKKLNWGLPPWLFGDSVASLRSARWMMVCLSLGPSLATPATLAGLLATRSPTQRAFDAASQTGGTPALCASRERAWVLLGDPNRPHAVAMVLGNALRWWLQAEGAGSAGMPLSGSRAPEPLLARESTPGRRAGQSC